MNKVDLIEKINEYQVIRITNNLEKYNRDIIHIDKNIFYKQYRNVFMLTLFLDNGDRDPLSFYVNYIVDKITIDPIEFLERLEIVKNAIIKSYN